MKHLVNVGRFYKIVESSNLYTLSDKILEYMFIGQRIRWLCATTVRKKFVHLVLKLAHVNRKFIPGPVLLPIERMHLLLSLYMRSYK